MIEKILTRLSKVKKVGPQKWKAACPAHQDSDPSLYLTQLSDGRILIKDFGGCGACDVMAAIGLELKDLFPDGALGEYRSFHRIEEDMKARDEAKKTNDKLLTQLALEKRFKGEKLTAKEKELAIEAFKRMRNANPNR